MKSAPQALLVDFGGVLTTSTVEATRAWCRTSGITYRQFVGPLIAPGRHGLPSLLDRLETGAVGVEEFERELGAAITAGSGVTVALAGFVRDVIGSAQLDEAMLRLVDEVRAGGLRTGLLSNSWGNDYPMAILAPHFDDIVISGEVGLRKPDPAIFALAVERIGVPATRCVFVDDLKANVATADQLGMTGILHTSAAATRARLEQLLRA